MLLWLEILSSTWVYNEREKPGSTSYSLWLKFLQFVSLFLQKHFHFFYSTAVISKGQFTHFTNTWRRPPPLSLTYKCPNMQMVLVYFPQVFRYCCHNKRQKGYFKWPSPASPVRQEESVFCHRFPATSPDQWNLTYSFLSSLPLSLLCRVCISRVYETHVRLDVPTHATLSSHGLPSVMYTVYINCFPCMVFYWDWFFLVWNGQAFWPSLPS